MAEQLDTKSGVKLGGFLFQLEASCVSGYTDELWYNETVCVWQYIYIYIYIYIFFSCKENLQLSKLRKNIH